MIRSTGYGLLCCVSSLLVGCGDALIVDPDTLSLDFAVTSSISCDAESDFRIIGSVGVIEISGIFGTPNGGYKLSPLVEAPGPAQIVVTIQGEQQGLGLTIPFCLAYELKIDGIPKGEYEVHLIHADRTFDLVHTVSVNQVRVW